MRQYTASRSSCRRPLNCLLLITLACLLAAMGCQQDRGTAEAWEEQARVNQQMLEELGAIRAQLTAMQPDADLANRVLGQGLDGDLRKAEAALEQADYASLSALLAEATRLNAELERVNEAAARATELEEHLEAMRVQLAQAVAAAEKAGEGVLLTDIPAVGVDGKGPRSLNLPGVATNAIWAGGGRYILFQLDAINQIAVVDIEEEVIKGYLRLPAERVLMTASMDKAFIVLPEQGLIQRWSLDTLERETVRRLPFEGKATLLETGWAANGPILVQYAHQAGVGRGGINVLLDPDQFEPVELDRPLQELRLDCTFMRFSANGTTLGGWRTNVSPSGLFFAQIDGTTVTHRYDHTTVGYVCPGPEGKLLFTRSGVFTANLQRVGDNQSYRGAFLPTTHAGFFISVPGNLGGGGEIDRPGSVFMGRSLRPVVTLPDTPDLLEGANPRLHPMHDYSGIAIDRRIMYAVQRNKLVTINPTGEKVTFRDFNLELQLARAGVDYLLVVTDPPLVAAPGRPYTYTVEVMSNHDGVGFSVEAGPEGMAINPETGELTWTPDAGFRGDAIESVIVLIRNSGGQETYHTFTINPE